jgi:hypothetical protein
MGYSATHGWVGRAFFVVALVTRLLWQDPQGWRRWIGVAAVAMIVIVTPISILLGSRSWADTLEEDARLGRDPSEGPFPIRLVLQPEIGTATIETDAGPDPACVLRISDRVFLGSAVVVVRDVTSFTAHKPSEKEPDCEMPDRVPWSTPYRGG